MASSAGGDDASKRRSIVIMDMPVEFINRDILKNHFEQFGSVERMACSVSKRYAIIHFSTAEEAENAAARGAAITADGPRLKIVNRSVGAASSSAPVKPVAPSSPLGRVVTRRKIVRNFTTPTPSGATSPEVSPSSSRGSAQSPEKQPQMPLKSSVKISRPSPFLRRKPSYGDKAAKPGGSSVPRNPFALPPRSLLSFDRRKKTAAQEGVHRAKTTTSGTAGDVSKVTSSSSAIETGQKTDRVVVLKSSSNPGSAERSSTVSGSREHGGTIDLNTDQGESHTRTDDISSASAVVDIDETTEDAPINDDDETVDDVDNGEDNDDDYEEDIGADADTQDTAEATTEEEGEILDDQQEEDDDEDAAFESPLKRAEMESKSTAASSTAGGLFSFKLKPSAAPAAESSFKLPFSSPFSSGSGSALKPFPSTGSTFGGFGGSRVFAGGPSTSSSAQQESKGISSSKEVKLQPQPDSKKETVPARKESEKSSQFSFGSFSSPSFGSNVSNLSNKSSNFGTSSGLELKASTLPSSSKSSAPTTSVGSTSASSSSSFLQAMSKRITPSAATITPSSSKEATAQKSQHPSAAKDAPAPNPLLLTFYPDTTEAQELFSKKSSTVEERYRILEARDKLIRARVPKTKVNVEFATKLIGTCPDMCSEKERYMRQFQRQLVSYETLAGPDFVVDHQKAVKAYSRSSADQEEPLPHELRPGPTLDFTMHYLLRYIVPLGDNPDEYLSDWYNFLWDRTRSIRKDITQQQIIDLTAVSLYEKCARFHIHCASNLCELDVHSFDPKLNDENLMKCLQSLEHLYEDLRRRNVTCPSEPEFRAYQIMMNLNEGDALYNAQQLPSWILNSEVVQTALKLHHSIYTKNFVAFFKFVGNLPYMTACILHRYFFQVRSLALRCFMKAHCTLPKYETAMPMSTLQRMLGFGPDQTMSFSYLCEAHGIHCDVDEGRVILKRKMFYLPESPSIYRETYLVDSKLRTSVAEAINGGPLPDIDIANHLPHSSFNEGGQLIPGNIVGGTGTDESTSSLPVFVPPDISTTSSRFQFQPAKAVSFAPAGIQSAQPFGEGSFHIKPKEVPPPVKPKRDIEAACQVITSKLIEESVRKDVIRLSEVQLDEAKRAQEQQQKKQLHEQIASRLSMEYVEQAILNQVDVMIRSVTTTEIRQQNAVEMVSINHAGMMLEENVLDNLRSSARTEMQLAKEFQHQLIMSLGGIFQKIRARFVLEKWMRFTKLKKRKREREEEKRREELWNFPAINSYSLSTKGVFKSFCGKGSVQPSLDKGEQLNKSLGLVKNTNVRPKRKSDGDIADYNFGAPSKLPRLASGTNIVTELDRFQQKRLNDMWEFPAANPYSRTNREVLQAFCGSSSGVNVPVSPKMTTFRRAITSSSNSSTFQNDFTNSFKIHKPATLPSSINQVSQEIRNKASQSVSDLLQNIKGFVSQVQEETKKSINLEELYMGGIEEIGKTCPELNSHINRSFMKADEGEDLVNEDALDWMNVHDIRPSILSGVFLQEDVLLNKLRNFVREVKCETAQSWNTETFLNNFDLDNMLEA